MLNQEQIVVSTKGSFTIMGLVNPITKRLHTFSIIGHGFNRNGVYATLIECEKLIAKKIQEILKRKEAEDAKKLQEFRQRVMKHKMKYNNINQVS